MPATLLAPRATASLEGELAEIESSLARLEAEREELRVELGLLVLSNARALDPGIDREAKAITERMDKIAERITPLRARRREIDAQLRPATPVAAAIVTVPMAPALVKAQRALDEARAEREALVREATRAVAGEDEKSARKMRGQIEEMEAKIKALRVRRGELLEPHNAALTEALRPVVLEAAGSMHAAAVAFLEALATLNEAALLAPLAHTGMPSLLGHAAGLDGRGVAAGDRLALELLRCWGEGAEQVVAAE